MNWSRHMILLTISAALLVVVAVTGAWAVESGFGTRADARSLPLVALGSATIAPGSSSAPTMTQAADARLVVNQSLRMSSGPIKSGALGAGGTMMTSPPTTATHGTPGTTMMPTSNGHGDMSTGSTASTASGAMMGTTPPTSTQTFMTMTTASSSPDTTRTTSAPVTPTSTYMGGGMGSTTGTTGGSGMGGMTAP